nr:hypothetical protein GCM10017745_34650 [Saccharothrix mutabilis subsp. capreolus]
MRRAAEVCGGGRGVWRPVGMRVRRLPGCGGARQRAVGRGGGWLLWLAAVAAAGGWLWRVAVVAGER